MSGAADVTVSIVNHESRDAVLAGLAALTGERDRRSALQIVVVDNASQDGSFEAIRQAFPGVEVLAQGDRHGFGANHNAALAVARGRHVLLLNDDTLVQPGAIDALTDYLDAHPSVAIAAPRVVDGDGATQASAWPLPSPSRDVVAALTLGRRIATRSTGDAARAVGWAMGCALLVRRDALERAGGFDEAFFMYSEEIDLSARLAALGFETHWVPAAAVVHEGQASTGGHTGAARAVEMARSRRRYWELHYRPAGRLAARLAVCGQFALLALAARLRGRPAEAFWLQARESWAPTGRPGLREAAAAFNGGSQRLG